MRINQPAAQEGKNTLLSNRLLGGCQDIDPNVVHEYPGHTEPQNGLTLPTPNAQSVAERATGLTPVPISLGCLMNRSGSKASGFLQYSS